MKIGTKLNLAFFGITLLLIISTVVSFINLKQIQNNSDEAFNNRVKQIQVVDDIRAHIGMQGTYARELMLDTTEGNKEKLISYASTLDEDISELNTLVRSNSMKNYLNDIIYYNDEFNKGLEQILKYVENGDIEAATKMITQDLRGANYGILNTTDNILSYQNQQLKKIQRKTAASVNTSIIVSVVLSIFSILFTVISIFIVRRSITSPLGKVMKSAEQIASGNLTHSDLNLKQKDEIGQLGHIFDEMKNHLNKLIHGIQDNAEQLSAAAEQLSASTEEINHTGTLVTSQVENAAKMASNAKTASFESAQAMNETASGIQNIAEASSVLQDTSLNASSTATEGKTIIHNAQNQMIHINEATQFVNELVLKLSNQTKEIDRIVKVISDITEQTNLLALNASIEAARAGEHGKGFAVVADEVKKLAEESNNSASLIGELIGTIQKDSKEVSNAVQKAITSVNDGVEIISVAGTSFESIVTAIGEMTSQIQEISATSEQLSASAEQVTASVEDIASGAEIASTNLTTIAASTEEQVAIMNEINQIATNLTTNAIALTEEAKKFKVR